MLYRSKRYRSTLVLQIMLAHIHAAYGMPILPRNVFQYEASNTDSYLFKDPIENEDPQEEDKPNTFLRNSKADNQARMFNIDLSRLRHNTPMHKAPVNLLGIDISVLSRNPDPALPLIAKHPKDKVNEKFIMGYDFDSRFDRLPIIKAKPIRMFATPPQKEIKAILQPMAYLPLNVITAYHSALTNKKEESDFSLDESSNEDDIEQKYTANFILRLLYQLSSHYKKARYT